MIRHDNIFSSSSALKNSLNLPRFYLITSFTFTLLNDILFLPFNSFLITPLPIPAISFFSYSSLGHSLILPGTNDNFWVQPLYSSELSLSTYSLLSFHAGCAFLVTSLVIHKIHHFLLLLCFSLQHLVLYFPPDSPHFSDAYPCIYILIKVIYWCTLGFIG